jgi:hypothetical protein
MKRTRLVRTVFTLTMVMLASAAASAQTGEPRIEVRVTPAASVEERVANDVKEKALRKAAEDKRTAEEADRVAVTSPKALLSRVRILYISSNTDYFETVQLQNALRKRSEIEAWQIAMIDGWDSRNVADTEIEIDRPLFTFTFTYKITNRSTGILLATGKVNAFDGNAAAPMLAERIVEEIRRARGEAKPKK